MLLLKNWSSGSGTSFWNSTLGSLWQSYCPSRMLRAIWSFESFWKTGSRMRRTSWDGSIWGPDPRLLFRQRCGARVWFAPPFWKE
jgi:hypothetical protein